MKKKAVFAIILFSATISMGELAGYWPFDEGTGQTVADSSGNGKNGALYAADSTNYPQWTTGHSGTGNALIFNANTTGTSNRNHVVVDIGSTDALANLGNAFTISMWVRRDSYGDWEYWPRLIYTNAYEVQLALDPDWTPGTDDTYDFISSTLSSAWLNFSLGAENDTQKTLESWYHLAVVCDGQFVAKYVNGVLVTSQGAPGSALPAATIDFYIGAKSNSSDYFIGALDDVAVWSGTYLAQT